MSYRMILVASPKKAFFKKMLSLFSWVDWSGRRETPVGGSGQVRPRRRERAEEAHRHSTESECLERKSTFTHSIK
jgi:hypothetical protein